MNLWLVAALGAANLSTQAAVQSSSLTDWIQALTAAAAAVFALLALVFGVHQLRISVRSQRFDVYKRVFEMVDGIRLDRHYVGREMSETTFEKEGWLSLERVAEPEPGTPQAHRASAERVFRTFDQLGLMVREGVVPVDLVGVFYCRPILEAWSKLCGYIDAVRGQRQQPGHGWHFENLVFEVVIKNLEARRGVWRDQLEHDNLTKLIEEIKDKPLKNRSRVTLPARWWRWTALDDVHFPGFD